MSTDESFVSVQQLWWLFVIYGLAALGIGIFFVISPHETLSVFTVIAGIVLVVDGVIAVIRSITGELENRGLLALVGVISVVAGLVLIKHPFNSLVVLALIIGLWFVIVGGIRFVAALADRQDRLANVLLSLLDIVIGIVILSWPEIGLATIAVIVGIGLIIRGGLFVVAGFELRSAPPRTQPPRPCGGRARGEEVPRASPWEPQTRSRRWDRLGSRRRCLIATRELGAHLHRPYRPCGARLQDGAERDHDQTGDEERLGAEHEDADAAEYVGRSAYRCADRRAQRGGRQAVAPGASLLHADQPRGHGHVGDHHHPHDDPEHDREPRVAPARHDRGGEGEQRAHDGARDDHRLQTLAGPAQRRSHLGGGGSVIA